MILEEGIVSPSDQMPQDLVNRTQNNIDAKSEVSLDPLLNLRKIRAKKADNIYVDFEDIILIRSI